MVRVPNDKIPYYPKGNGEGHRDMILVGSFPRTTIQGSHPGIYYMPLSLHSFYVQTYCSQYWPV